MGVAHKKKPVPVYLRGIPAEVVREAKAQAALRGVTLAGYVAETLARAAQEPSGSPGASARREPTSQADGDLATEARWYEQHRERLSREYEGEFIAIVNKRVVDHDVAFEALAERIFKLRGARDTFMPEVRSKPRTVRIRSPRVSRRR